jgi:hypothetical protein
VPPTSVPVSRNPDLSPNVMSVMTSKEKYANHSIMFMIGAGLSSLINFSCSFAMKTLTVSSTHGSYLINCDNEKAELIKRRCRSCQVILVPENKTSISTPFMGTAVTRYASDCGGSNHQSSSLNLDIYLSTEWRTTYLLRSPVRSIYVMNSLRVCKRQLIGSEAYNVTIFAMDLDIELLL